MSEVYKEKAKVYLCRQLDDYIVTIEKLKRKRNLVKGLFISLNVISITSSTVCAALAGFTLPPLIIPILSTAAGLTTALSVKFDLQDEKQTLDKTIDQLDKVKRKIDYVVSCNSNFTEAKYCELLGELS